jgi:endonuclease G, mitochondrial
MAKPKFRSLFIATFLILFGCSTSQQSSKASSRRGVASTPGSQGSLSVEFPGLESISFRFDQQENLVVLKKKDYFVTLYNVDLRLPQLSAYLLTADHLKIGAAKRQNHFFADNALQQMGYPAVRPSDYDRSGYDRGHLANSADFEWDQEANDMTFVMSNMTPQKPKLNRNAWEALEAMTRLWACAAGELIVITGPILTSPLKKLHNNLVVPQKFFKILINPNVPMHAIGFVMNQQDSSTKSYLAEHYPVHLIEDEIGIHFFDRLSEVDRSSLENEDDFQEWPTLSCTPHTENSIPLNHISRRRTKAAPEAPTEVVPEQPSGACAMGTLKPADIAGCCRGHQGVMGPKKGQACCNEQNQILCNDGSIASDRCQCQ